jgi:hypothetical protein
VPQPSLPSPPRRRDAFAADRTNRTERAFRLRRLGTYRRLAGFIVAPMAARHGDIVGTNDPHNPLPWKEPHHGLA